MKSFLSNLLGPLMMLIGAVILAIYFFNTIPENTLLIVAGALMVIGMVSHILINKFIKE
jgi:membrane protein YdbS with pleckstrin-like domain